MNNSKTRLYRSAKACHTLSNAVPTVLERRFSRRTMLGGLALFAGASMAGCTSIFEPPQPAPTSARALLPTPTPTPTPVPLGTTLITYMGHSGRVNALAWSPDGTRIASASGLDGTVLLWDALTGADVLTHQGYTDAGATLAWSPNGRRIASGHSKVRFGVDDVEIWDPESGTTFKTYNPHVNSPASGPVNGLSWSPDGTSLAAASYDYTARVWDLANDQIRFLYRDPNGYLLTCVAWSPDSTLIVFGNDDNGSHDIKLQIWNVATQTRRAILRGHTAPIQTVDWSPDGQYIASGANDNTARIWHVPTASLVLTYQGHNQNPGVATSVLSVAWSPDGTRIASAGVDGTVQIWEAATGRQVYIYREQNAAVYAARWSPNGQYIASGGDDETVQIWQAV